MHFHLTADARKGARNVLVDVMEIDIGTISNVMLYSFLRRALLCVDDIL